MGVGEGQVWCVGGPAGTSAGLEERSKEGRGRKEGRRVGRAGARTGLEDSAGGEREPVENVTQSDFCFKRRALAAVRGNRI